MSDTKTGAPLWRRTLVMLPSVPGIGLAVALLMKANMGMDPFTSFQSAISPMTGLSVGTWSVILNSAIVIAFLFIDRKLIGLGSVVFAAGIGPFINLFSGLLDKLFPGTLPLWSALICVLAGTVIISASIANYLPLQLGAQATDMISITLGRLTHKTVGFGMILFNGVMFVIAVLLGAVWGLGTLSCVFLVGKLVDWLSPVLNPLSLRLAGMEPAPSAKG